MNMEIGATDELVMKLLHYFITEKNYTPVVVYGVKNEIWLENMDEDYKIVRIVSNYILNDEQLKVDNFRTKSVIKSIKKKTLNLSINTLNIFTDLGENVNLGEDKHMNNIYVRDVDDLKKYDFLYKYFPDIDKKLKFSEEGVMLFLKVTQDINKKNKEEAVRVENIFKPKTVVITYILMAINILIFLYGMLGNQAFLVNNFATYGPFIKMGDWYRLITGCFIHADIMHIAFNMYALYILGRQAETFFGKTKFLIIYFLSALGGSLLSILLNVNTVSVGASGAIFGILGAMLYFGYNFRVYLGNNLYKQIITIILLNVAIGMFSTGIDLFAHLGGLVAGFLVSYALGLKSKSKASDHVNGVILTLLYFGFLIFMNFIYK